jgi:serine/threonine kinase PknH
MQMLPSGYCPGSCEPATTPPRALAKTVCTHNGDPAGPTAATYTLVADKASLRPLFDDPLRGSTIVTCPGNIESPGPWRCNATPQQVSGTLVCSYRDGLAAVTWTTEANLLVSDVHADRAGPALNQLNQWRSAHS